MNGPNRSAESQSAVGAASAGDSPVPVARLLHDLKQPLSAINTYALAGTQLIDNGLADMARLKDLFGKIIAQSARASALSQDMGKAVAAIEQQS